MDDKLWSEPKANAEHFVIRGAKNKHKRKHFFTFVALLSIDIKSTINTFANTQKMHFASRPHGCWYVFRHFNR